METVELIPAALSHSRNSLPSPLYPVSTAIWRADASWSIRNKYPLRGLAKSSALFFAQNETVNTLVSARASDEMAAVTTAFDPVWIAP